MEKNCNFKKIHKKHFKHQHVVSKECGVTCVSFPTKYIAICNAGQINGLTEEILLENFKQFGLIERVALYPGKSCCFIVYENISSAQKAMEECNGRLNIAQNNKPIFLSYIENLPKIIIEKQFKFPPGMMLLENFITEKEEAMLLNLYNFNQETENSMKNRQVKHYGFEFRYDINNVDKDKPLAEKIPEECSFLWARLNSINNLNFNPNQLTINYYNPGQGIPAHIDTHSAFEDPIISISLGSSVVMEFRKDRNYHYCVLLPTRSCAILSGESRYCWTHAIIPRQYDFYKTESNGYNTIKRGIRVSFTFRKVLEGDCECIYKNYCDSNKNNLDVQNRIATELENKHVLDVYENIASHFSDTRHKPWPNVIEFLQSFSIGDILIDVGCGNGKYLNLNKNLYILGCDTSFGLLDICKEQKFECFNGNCLNIPLKDCSVDGVICIAVIHHLANEERRLHAIKEIVRLLRIGGTALIYVWAKDQYKDQIKTTYLKQDRKNRKTTTTSCATPEVFYNTNGLNLPIHLNRTQFKHKDLLVPWKLKNNEIKESTFLRFYHVFEEDELENLCKNISNIIIERNYYDQGNWCVVIKKTA